MSSSKYPEDKRLVIEEALREFCPSSKNYPEIIYRAMEYSLFSGGKRFRPVLTWLTAEALGCDPREVSPTACAIEYIHTYSLIHDDLPAIDNDTLRRGQPTCHIVFGEAIAILAGDALFAEAFYLIASRQKGDPTKVVQVIAELATATGARGMVAGQAVDIKSTRKQVDSATLDFIHLHKTGDLIVAAVRCGAILAGATIATLDILSEYARQLGLAFQIIDDILDVAGETVILGKEVGSDERRFKVTYPSVYGLKRSRQCAREAVDKAKKALGNLDITTKTLADIADFVYQRRV